MASRARPVLAGKRILVVEDEYFIAQDVCDVLRDCGADIVGPAWRLDQGVRLAKESDPLHGAVLDLNLAGTISADIAHTLQARNICFILLTGYDVGAIAEEFCDVPHLVKPFDADELCHVVSREIAASQR